MGVIDQIFQFTQKTAPAALSPKAPPPQILRELTADEDAKLRKTYPRRFERIGQAAEHVESSGVNLHPRIHVFHSGARDHRAASSVMLLRTSDGMPIATVELDDTVSTVKVYPAWESEAATVIRALEVPEGASEELYEGLRQRVRYMNPRMNSPKYAEVIHALDHVPAENETDDREIG